MLRIGLASIVMLAAAGCSVLIDSTRLTGGTGATADASSPDATVPIVTDAGGLGDANANAEAASGPRLCDRAKHDFCTDFDDANVFDGFKDSSGKAEGYIAASTARFVSSPQSLFANLPRRETQKQHATVTAHLEGAWARTVVELDVYIVQPAFLASDSNAGIFCLNFVNVSGDAHGACLSVAKSFTTFSGNGPPFPFDRWVHLRFDLDPFTNTGAFALDGVETKGPIEVPTGDPLLTMIEIGVLGYNVPAPEFNVHIDNLTIDRL